MAWIKVVACSWSPINFIITPVRTNDTFVLRLCGITGLPLENLFLLESTDLHFLKSNVLSPCHRSWRGMKLCCWHTVLSHSFCVGSPAFNNAEGKSICVRKSWAIYISLNPKKPSQILYLAQRNRFNSRKSLRRLKMFQLGDIRKIWLRDLVFHSVA